MNQSCILFLSCGALCDISDNAETSLCIDQYKERLRDEAEAVEVDDTNENDQKPVSGESRKKRSKGSTKGHEV
jgi:hypothetical protein